MNRITLIIILFIAFVSIGYAQDNPFFTKEGPEENKQVSSPELPEFIQKLSNEINNLQRELNNSLSTLSRKINEEEDFGILFLLLGIALLYGFIHALGPGHGKIIIVSYALSNPLKAKQGILLGIFIAVIHTLSAIFLVSILYFILKSTYSGYSQEPKKIIFLVSYGLIACMGAFLIVKTIIVDILKLNKKSWNSKTKIDERQNKIQNLILPAFIIGLVPCEGAILILIFSISINAYLLGIMLTAAMSLGMALTISIIGIITIYSKKGVLKLVSAKTGIVKTISIVIQIIGAVLILLFGLLLFLSKIT